MPRPEPRDAKPQPSFTTTEPKAEKEETSKCADVKSNTKSPIAPEQQCSGHYQLNALMTKMVDAELQDLMAKAWQELPNNPTNHLEAMIIDTLKDKAWQDLKNVLGLNMTKRLLNVYNPFDVKVQFNAQPDKEALREFLRRYHFTSFARKAVNIFSARVRTVHDFDRLCSGAEVRCGNINVSVSPIYKFTACPPNLKTNYSDISIDNDESELIEMKKADDIKIENKETAKETNKTVTKSIENVSLKVTEEKTENISKVEPKKVTKDNEVKKPIESAQNPAQDTSSNKSETPTVVNNINSTKTVTKITSQITDNVVNTTTVTTATKVSSKTKATSTPLKPIQKKQDPKASSPQKGAKVKLQKFTHMSPQKLTKVTLQKSLKVSKAGKVEDDYDELDDHDILALMSEGIVLDECSGSDDE